MHRAVTHLPLALLFLALVVPSNGQMRRSEKQTTGETVVTVKLGAPLTVECSLQPQQKVEWRLDGGSKPDDMKPTETATTSQDAVIAKLSTSAATARHAGLYTCAKASPRTRVKIIRATNDTDTTPAPPPSVPDFVGKLQYYEVRALGGDHVFQLNCTSLTGPGPITWTKNGTALSDIPELKDHLVTKEDDTKLSVKGRSTEDDFGNYTCSNGASQQAFIMKGRLYAKLASDTNVVEGQKLKISCKVIGKPCSSVVWTYTNDTFNGTDVKEVFGSRLTLLQGEQGINDTELVIEPAARSDAGFFNCTPVTDQSEHAFTARTQLRVKDMYAALWPFLGICAEVFVLCAVILVYEKRRTKPELDDSDTDNHDQKKS